MNKIALIKFGALGDVLMTTPLVRQLRRAFPSSSIDYFVGEAFAPAIRDNPAVNEVTTFDETIFTQRKILGLSRLLQSIRNGRYETIYILDKHPIFCAIAALARVPQRIGFARDRTARFLLHHAAPYGGVRHEVHCYLDLLRANGLSPDYGDTQLELSFPLVNSTELRKKFPEIPSTFVACINSGGNNIRENGGARALPWLLFRELIEILTPHISVVLLGSSADSKNYCAAKLPANCFNLAGRTTLNESASILRMAQRVYSTDCGAMHLAAASGAKAFCLFFGPSHPRRKAPLNGEAEIIWANSERYDPAYEDFGRVPTTDFFANLSLQPLREQLLAF